MSARHEVIICSNRSPENLLKILKNLESCENANQAAITVILNGNLVDRKAYLLLVNDFNGSFREFNVDFSEPGLAKARNFALDKSNSEIITFIDDDISVPISFLKEIEQMFLKDSELVGCSPKIADQYKLLNRVNWLTNYRRRLLNRRQGKVTKNGSNYWIIDSDDVENRKVDWLPGCCMSYRKSKIEKLRFSTCLENGPTGGYALGEDIDFSMRASVAGPLRVNNSVRIMHLKYDGIRNNYKAMSLATGAWNAYQIRNFRQQIKLSCVLVSLVVDLVRNIIRFLFARRFAIINLQVTLYRLFGLLYELAFPRLVRRYEER